jgi:hypothetical protein
MVIYKTILILYQNVNAFHPQKNPVSFIAMRYSLCEEVDEGADKN